MNNIVIFELLFNDNLFPLFFKKLYLKYNEKVIEDSKEIVIDLQNLNIRYEYKQYLQKNFIKLIINTFSQKHRNKFFTNNIIDSVYKNSFIIFYNTGLKELNKVLSIKNYKKLNRYFELFREIIKYKNLDTILYFEKKLNFNVNNLNNLIIGVDKFLTYKNKAFFDYLVLKDYYKYIIIYFNIIEYKRNYICIKI